MRRMKGDFNNVELRGVEIEDTRCWIVGIGSFVTCILEGFSGEDLVLEIIVRIPPL